MQCKCGNSIHPGRVALNYKTCIACGEVAAQSIIKQRSNQLVQMPKSNLMLVTGGTRLEKKHILRTMITKNGNH